MDFFAHQDKARKASGFLVMMYIIAVIAIAGSIHLLFSFILYELDDGEFESNAFLTNPEVILWTVGVPLLIIIIGTLIKVVQLSGGGSSVAVSAGGRAVSARSKDRLERRLHNIVEEMAISSGVRVPAVFVLDDEEGINAFAAGYSSNDAAVAVTAGALKSLNREELQAVIGHEFSHILNGDMRLNIWLIGVLGGILGMAVTGRIIMRVGADIASTRSGRSKDKDNTAAAEIAIVIIGFLVWIIGLIGVFFGRMIQSAVSRKREYLADASSVQFTRNPQGLANALKIIGATEHHGMIGNGHASELSHMFFTSGVRCLFATHPPLDDRIRVLDPAFTGDYNPARKTLQTRLALAESENPVDADEERECHRALLAAALAAAGTLPGSSAEGETGKKSEISAPVKKSMPKQAQPANPKAMPPPLPEKHSAAEPPPLPGSANVNSDMSRTAKSHAVHSGMPKWLDGHEIEALADIESAECCLYGSVLSRDEAIRAIQLNAVKKRESGTPGDFVTAVGGWAQHHANWTCIQKRAVCEIAANTLRSVDQNACDNVIAVLDELGRADGRIDSFEFALSRMVRRRLAPDSGKARRRTLQPKTLRKEISTVISALAWFGGRTPNDASAAYVAGMDVILPIAEERAPAKLTEPDLVSVETAMDRLAYMGPIAKRTMMQACRKVVSNDGETTEIESNILASIADAMSADGWAA